MTRRERWRQRLHQGIGLDELDAIERRLPALEEAVAENARLAEPLERLVTSLEQGLVPSLEQALGETSVSVDDGGGEGAPGRG